MLQCIKGLKSKVLTQNYHWLAITDFFTGKQPNYRVDSQDVDDESGESSKSGSSGNSRVSNEPVECEGLLYEEQNGDQDPETIIISSDEMSDQEDEMAGEWSTGAGAKLKMVFDVEYVAPE